MRIVDLFCGVGGFRLGCETLGEVVYSSEWDKFSQRTYKENFGDLPQGDITKIEAQEIPNHDLLCAGFPCQAFSIGGLKRGFEDTRGTLFFDVVRIAKHHKTSVLFLENVKGLLYHDKARTFKIIVETLKDLGYRVYTKVLNTKDFGLPQNRERLFFVCFRDHTIDFEFPVPPYTPCKVGDILQDEVNPKYMISAHIWKYHQERKEKNRINKKGFGYRLFNENSSHTSCITARYYKDGSEALIDTVEGLSPRRLTPREVARLQGFSDSFKLPCSDTQSFKQLGNSVSVPVIFAISQKIKESLRR
tara:strand:+ start:470 stop:1381 length:912 start_codon:yes stop_codon:yes gene_type:complete